MVSALLKQRRHMQAKVHFKFCYSGRKERTHKALKVAVAKRHFSSVYATDIGYYDECSLLHVVTGRHYF